MSGAAQSRSRTALALIGEPHLAGIAALNDLQRLVAQGYPAPPGMTDPEALLQLLRAGPPETVKLIDYTAFFGTLPAAAQTAVRARWGAPEDDPAYVPGELDCGAFLLSIMRDRTLAVGLEPQRGLLSDPPSHAFLAFQAWLRDEFRADRVIPVGALDDSTLDDEWRRLALGPLAPPVPGIVR